MQFYTTEYFERLNVPYIFLISYIRIYVLHVF